MAKKPIKASAVEPESFEFLWQGRIPRGALSLIAGKSGKGKSLLAAHIAAEISHKGKVLYSAAEDSFGQMTRPRLEAAGAKLENVMLWRFRLPNDAAELAQLFEQHKFDLLIMDPLTSHLGMGASRHSDNVRSVSDPLTDLIEHYGAACTIVDHALKRPPADSDDPLACIGGSSSGFPAAVRAAYLFGSDPDDADRRVLCTAKFNIGPYPKPLALSLDVVDLDEVGETALLEVEEELDAFDWRKLLTTKDPNQTHSVGRPPEKREAAAEWLTTYLAQNGKTSSVLVQEDARQKGMSLKTLRRAAEDMGVIKDPPNGGKNCTWDLPDDVKALMGIPLDIPPAKDEEPTGGDLSNALDEILDEILDDETTADDEEGEA